MASKSVKNLGSFTAHDAHGKAVRLHVYQEMIDMGDLRSGPEQIPGLKFLRDDRGNSVNRKEQGVYEIVQTGERLTSSDPAAP